MADVMDILELDKPQTPEGLTKETLDSIRNKLSSSKKKARFTEEKFTFKKPEGMHRELYALLYADNKDGPPIIPTDVMIPNISNSGGYKQVRAKLGLKKVRPWRWMPFANPGRSDGFMLHHWRRVADEGKEYPFAKFNKTVQVPSYSDNEYNQLLQIDGWSKLETDHLFALCRRFDLRFVIIHDRWERDTFQTKRSVEDLKERYYNVCNLLAKARGGNVQESKLKIFDAEHERKRKEQLIKLYNRTSEEVEEEQKLLDELRKIEMRKKEREKKTQDLQKLITAADTSSQSKKSDALGSSKHSTGGSNRSGRGSGRRKVVHKTPVASARDNPATPGTPSNILESAGIKFPEIKSSGTSLRSQRMKLPSAVGQKKSKAIEQLLTELNVELRPMPTEDICQHFNELRSDMVLLYELKAALSNCEYELQTLKHQYEALQPGKQLEIPPIFNSSTGKNGISNESAAVVVTAEAESPKKNISEIIDVTGGPITPNRKRRAAALEQQNLLKKLKKI